jgi:hypothetical protein
VEWNIHGCFCLLRADRADPLFPVHFFGRSALLSSRQSIHDYCFCLLTHPRLFHHVLQHRSVQMVSRTEASIDTARTHTREMKLPRPMSLAGNTRNPEVIDKASFFSATSLDAKPAANEETTDSNSSHSNWVPTELRPVPAFYPLERSSRFVEDELSTVASRISEANRVLSVQAIYNDETVSDTH